MKKLYLVSILFLLVIFASAQKSNMFKALFIYNFAKNVEWPASYNKHEFVIGIYGNSGIIEELNKISRKKKVNNKIIIVKKINSIASISKLNILYIPASKSPQISEIFAKARNKPILIITDKPGLAKKGSCINFIRIKGDLKFEINKLNIRKKVLKIDNSLLRLGILIQ